VGLPSEVLGAAVRHAEVPSLDHGRELSEWVRATPDEMRYERQGLRVFVRGTTEVLIDWDPGADETILEALLYGLAARTVLLHGGTFSIHGSLVELDGRGVALGGHSGAGKSTTAVELARRHGGRLVIDDVLPIVLEDGRPVSRPFARPLHLTDHAFDRAGFGPDDATRVGSGEVTKLALAVDPGEGPTVLHELVLLERDEEPGGPPIVVTELRGAERLRRLVHLSNVSGLASLGHRSAGFFAWATALADALPVVEVRRADGADTLDAIGTLLAERVASAR
jgi:hypothetical protein